MGRGNNVHWDFRRDGSFHWLHSTWLALVIFSSLPYSLHFSTLSLSLLSLLLTLFTSLLSSNPYCLQMPTLFRLYSFHFPTLHFSAFLIAPICTSLLSSFPMAVKFRHLYSPVWRAGVGWGGGGVGWGGSRTFTGTSHRMVASTDNYDIKTKMMIRTIIKSIMIFARASQRICPTSWPSSPAKQQCHRHLINLDRKGAMRKSMMMTALLMMTMMMLMMIMT